MKKRCCAAVLLISIIFLSAGCQHHYINMIKAEKPGTYYLLKQTDKIFSWAGSEPSMWLCKVRVKDNKDNKEDYEGMHCKKVYVEEEW